MSTAQGVAGDRKPTRPPYWIISAAEGTHTTELSGNSCTECHRPQCTTLFDGEDEDEEGSATAYKLAMPAPFHDLSTWDEPTAAADREAVRAWRNSLEPYGPQYDSGGDDEDGWDNEDDGACAQAYECALECGTSDYECARACPPPLRGRVGIDLRRLAELWRGRTQLKESTPSMPVRGMR